jgi:hypothetical protein
MSLNRNNVIVFVAETHSVICRKACRRNCTLVTIGLPEERCHLRRLIWSNFISRILSHWPLLYFNEHHSRWIEQLALPVNTV